MKDPPRTAEAEVDDAKILEPFSVVIDDVSSTNITCNILSNSQVLSFNTQPYKNNKVLLRVIR